MEDTALQEQTFDDQPQDTADIVVIERDDNGRISTSDGARAMARQRWQKRQEALERGAGRAVGGTSEDAVEQIAYVTTKRAVDPDDKRQLEAAREIMGRLLGSSDQDHADAMTVTATIPAKAIPDLVEALSKARDLRSSTPPT